MSTPAIRGIISPILRCANAHTIFGCVLRHTLFLALLVFSVAANHPHRPFAADDFAVLTDAFDAGSDFHVYRLTGKDVPKSKDPYCSTGTFDHQATRASEYRCPCHPA